MRNSQSPSIYSIYHNALPYYTDRVDLCQLTDEGVQFAASWLTDIINGNAPTQITASNLSVDRLRHLFFESKNFEKTNGAKAFGLGYPVFIDAFENELLLSPMFIWPLSIEPAQTKLDAWIIKLEQNHQVLPNYRLLKHLKEKYDLDWEEKVQVALNRNRFKRQELFALCDELAERLQFENDRPENGLNPCPGIDEIGTLSQIGSIHWSAILGLFPPQYTREFASIAKPEEVLSPYVDPVPDDHCIFTYLTDDPHQTTAVETVFRNKVTVLENEVAQPRTIAIVNLIFNALSNGKKCLVVSEKVPALKITQNLLSKTGLDQLHFLLDDAQNDKLPMLELLRVAAQGTSRTITHNPEDFLFKKNKYLRDKFKFDAAFSAVRKKVFGEYDWTETVGLFLASNRIEGRELLTSQLNNQEFVFTIKEYEDLKQGILNCHTIFKKIKTLSHPLSNLHDHIFINFNSIEAQQLVEKLINNFTVKAAQLQHRYITKMDTYASRLKEHYENHYQYLAELNRNFKEKMLGYGDRLGDDFKVAGGGSLKFTSIFSSKKKQILNAQEDVAKAYRLLEKAYLERQYFDFHFNPSKEGMNIQKNIQNQEAFSQALQQWHNRIDNIVQEEIMRLNGKTVHPDLDYKEQIIDLEYSLDVFLEELNANKLYQKIFENKTLTLPQRQKYLESIIEQLENTQLNIRDFQLFFQWQSQWLMLDALNQKVIRALVKVKPADWMAAFESWYFNNLLNKVQSSSAPFDDSVIENSADSWHSLKPLIKNQILYLWQKKQTENLRALKRKEKEIYRLIFEKNKNNKSKQLPLNSILEDSFDAVTAFLPVMFVTSHIAKNELPKVKDYFDLIIIDGANSYTVESACVLALLGKRLVLCGSNDGLDGETSLVQYALESGAPSVNFSDTNGWMHSVSTSHESSHLGMENIGELHSDNVEGRFHELDGTNDIEAQYIIRLLNQIKQTPQRIYPSTGIITLTVEQRDLISNYLLRLKQQNTYGSEKIQQLERNGLGVFHFSELSGQQFDILILSCTYGTVNLKGTMTKKIAFLNTPDGITHLKSILRHRGQKTFVIHSFSSEQIDKFISKRSESGTWVLSNFIRLIEGIKNENKDLIKRTSEELGLVKRPVVYRSIFGQELINALLPYIDEKRFTKNIMLNNIHVALSIKPIHKDAPAWFINPDGLFSKTNYSNSIWENQQKNYLTSIGFKYLPVWSVNWLKNPLNEARLLASKIIKQDSGYKLPVKIKQENKSDT